MTYIPEISQSATAQLQSKQKSEKENTLGQDDFLTLLVAQLQNQDPLNPSDPTEFTSQLAQFSELEQLFNLNDSMEQLATAQNNSERLSALSMIGKEILVEGSSFQLGEDVAEIGYRVDGKATDITLYIQNSLGQRVATLHGDDFTEGNHFISWNGQGVNGEHLPPGSYEIVINAQGSADGEKANVSSLVRNKVTGVDLSDTGALLVTQAGEYSVTSIHGVYEQKDAFSEPKDGKEFISTTLQDQQTISTATDGTGITETVEAISTVL